MTSEVERMMVAPIPRDRWGRPLIVPPGGGRAVPYTRVSTMAKALSDTYGLTLWKQRQTAIGLAARPDLLALVQSAKSDKQRLDQIVEQAMEAAGSSAGANYGTALHALAEQYDRGTITPESPDLAGSPAQADLAAYVRATEHLTMLAVETFVVVDSIECAGTFDRLIGGLSCAPDCPGVHVADIKTGTNEPDFPHPATIQCGIYARGTGYTVERGRTITLADHGVCQQAAILIHLPRYEARCDLFWLNIVSGWQMAQVAHGTRTWLKTTPIGRV